MTASSHPPIAEEPSSLCSPPQRHAFLSSFPSFCSAGTSVSSSMSLQITSSRHWCFSPSTHRLFALVIPDTPFRRPSPDGGTSSSLKESLWYINSLRTWCSLVLVATHSLRDLCLLFGGAASLTVSSLLYLCLDLCVCFEAIQSRWISAEDLTRRTGAVSFSALFLQYNNQLTCKWLLCCLSLTYFPSQKMYMITCCSSEWPETCSFW